MTGADFCITSSYMNFLKEEACIKGLLLSLAGHILTSPIASSLPTLPFLVLKSLYDSSPLTTDDGVLLRRMSLEIWAIHLILACLSVLSHHAPRVPVQGFQQEVSDKINTCNENTSIFHFTSSYYNIISIQRYLI